MRQLFALFTFVNGCIFSIAQINITGKVTGPDNSVLPYAIVRAFENDSVFVKGCEIDSLGVYNMQLPKPGLYKFIYTSLGYKTKEITNLINLPVTNLGTTSLETDHKIIQEITVTGRRIDRQGNHLDIYPDATSVKNSFSAYQLLDNLKLPGFEIQPMAGIVEMFGNNVSLYIDGLPADYNTVKNLRSKDIEKIEFHDVPTGRYSHDYAAINFITKKYPFGGYATIEAQQNIGHLNGTYEAYAKMSKGNTQFSVSAGYSMWDMSRDKQYTLESYIFPDKTITRDDKNLGGHTKRNSEYGQVRISNSNEKRSLMGNVSLVHTYTDKNRNGELIYSSPADIYEKSFSQSRANTISPTATFYGYFSLPKQSYLIANAQGSYSHNSSNDFYTTNDKDLLTGANENYYKAFGAFILGKNFKHNNSTSLSVVEVYTSSSTNYSGAYTEWMHFWTSETLIFLDYRHQFSKFQFYVRPGISLNSTRIHKQKMMNERRPRFYIESTYRPNNSHQIKGSVAIGNGSIPAQFLSNIERPSNFLFALRGNPNLKRIMNMRSYELTYSAQLKRINMALMAHYDKNTNYPGSYYFAENDMIIQSFESGKASMVRIDPSISYSATKWLRFNLTGKYRHFNVDGSTDKILNNYSGKLSTTIFWKEFMLNIDLATKSKSMNFNSMNMLAVTESPATYSFNLSWNHKNWSASAWVTNPFNHIKTRQSLVTDAYKTHTMKISSISGFVKLIYTFDFGKKIQRTGVDRVNTSTGSAIL